jgi:hypothetical protein
VAEKNVLISRIVVPMLGILVWACYYLNARCAYRLRRSTKKLIYQFVLAVAPIFIGVLQVRIMTRFSPDDAYGSYFAGFIFLESGGTVIVLFSTLFRERARSRAHALVSKVGE